MDLSKLIEWVKLSPQYIGAILVASIILLFSPESFLEEIGVSEFVVSYRSWIGAVFVITSALLFSHAGAYIVGIIKSRREEKRLTNYGKKRLQDLTLPEKEILRGFIFNQTRSQTLSITDGNVKGLEHSKVIYRSSNLGSYSGFAYNIQQWAWEYLNKHPELLDEDDFQ